MLFVPVTSQRTVTTYTCAFVDANTASAVPERGGEGAFTLGHALGATQQFLVVITRCHAVLATGAVHLVRRALRR